MDKRGIALDAGMPFGLFGLSALVESICSMAGLVRGGAFLRICRGLTSTGVHSTRRTLLNVILRRPDDAGFIKSKIESGR